jgi:hypothetical protein
MPAKNFLACLFLELKSLIVAIKVALLILLLIYFFAFFVQNFLKIEQSVQIDLPIPLEIPCYYFSKDGVNTTFDENDKIVLFRGVHAAHPVFQQATEGCAIPWGGHDDAELHNAGNNKSDFTSWTTQPFVAYSFANKKKKKNGVILVMIFEKSQLTYSPDRMQQGEWLVKGVVKNCYVLKI